jgi:hypothetical protein
MDQDSLIQPRVSIQIEQTGDFDDSDFVITRKKSWSGMTPIVPDEYELENTTKSKMPEFSSSVNNENILELRYGATGP